MYNSAHKLGQNLSRHFGQDFGSIKSITLSLLIGFIGAGLASLLGVPAPALLGSTFAVSATSFFGLPMKMPLLLRNIGFTTIGCSLGTGITPEILDNAARWPLSLIVLTLLLLLIMFATSLILVRFFGLSKGTAVLSTSPGALSYTLALAEAGMGDIKSVSILQSLRLLIITICLPIILSTVGEEGQFSLHSPPVWLPIGHSLILMTVVYAAGFLGSKLRIPAAYILIGMIISGALHASGLLVGNIPKEILFIGFTLTGAVVGARFSSITRKDLKGLVVAAVTIFLVSSAFTATVAYFMSSFLAVPFGQIWVAYASGGVEAMAAMALSLDYDPAFVATHHIFRIVFLILMLPLLIRFLTRNKREA
ncbi:AbrB family transcriptional regulator [Kiloniella sp.]|uniref:AbrB family transcriptional regulator n=1 Tax=Kiloniella sp. TaxID=1938587 RepID=UPI003B01B651